MVEVKVRREAMPKTLVTPVMLTTVPGSGTVYGTAVNITLTPIVQTTRRTCYLKLFILAKRSFYIDMYLLPVWH